MNYHETLDFIHSVPRFGKKLGLGKIEALLDLMGNPQDKLKFVHVAGTNGKGSTCTMLSYILADAGYKTGLYISPYIIEFRERIQVNNEMIPSDSLAEIGTRVHGFWQKLDKEGDTPSEFEVVFAIALQYFVEAGCDIVVVEVGMGGRLDATNIIPPPLVAAITSISLDHVFNLGNTIEAIAGEKAGIIKPGSDVISYPRQTPEALAVIMERCAELGNKLVVPHNVEVLKMDLTGSEIVYSGQEYSIPLIGEHQIYNALTVIEICSALNSKGFPTKHENIYAGFDKTTFPIRMEIVGKNPLVIIDGAHNIGGAETLVKALEMVEGRKIYGIMGMVEDKDVESVISLLAPKFQKVVATWDKSIPRFIKPEKLGEKLKRHNPNTSVEDDPLEAFRKFYDIASPEDIILVCGSLYLGSVVRSGLKKLPPKED